MNASHRSVKPGFASEELMCVWRGRGHMDMVMVIHLLDLCYAEPGQIKRSLPNSTGLRATRGIKELRRIYMDPIMASMTLWP